MHSVPRCTPAYIAWLLPAGTLFFLCGILLGRGAETWIPALIALFLGLAAMGLSRDWRRMGAALMTTLAFGALLGWQAYHPAMPAEGEYTVRGTVVQEVALRDDGQLQTVLADVTLNGESWPDAYWTSYLDEGETLPPWLIPGAQVEFSANVYHPSGRENPGGFDFREYLLQRGIRFGVYGTGDAVQAEEGFSLRGWIAAQRHALSLQLMDVMGPEAGAYAAAMLLGNRDFIPADDRASFQELGIAHILSVSGFHVGVLIGLLLILMRPLPASRAVRMGMEAAILGAYCLLTGGNAPVIRAALLLLWREFTRLRHRQILPLHMLSVTALVQLLFNPTLASSASFQLTYGAMLGLLLVFPRLKKLRTFPTARQQKIWEAFCASVAAQLGILYPQLYWFGELSLLSVVLNMAVIPVFSGLIMLYWATLAALPIPGLRGLLGALSSMATTPVLALIRWLAALSPATLWTRQADGFTLIGWALLIAASSGLLPRRMKRHRRKLLLTGALLVALILIPLPEHNTTYTQLSVGDADAAVLQDGGVTVVIDTGEDGTALASYLHQRREAVEILIITHLHTDHGSGVRALIDQRIPVETCFLPWDAGVPVIDEELRPLLTELAETGTQIGFLRRGDVIDLPSGQLTALWPLESRVSALHDANDMCLVLYAEIGGVTMLLPSDLPAEYASYTTLPVDILKAAHHGSKSANTADSLAAVDPQLILLSNRLASREEHMTQLAGDIPLYLTDQDGAIIVRFLGDGEFVVETVKTAE